MTKQEFLFLIVKRLKENPEWLPDAILALNEGSVEAINTLSNRISKTQDAVADALMLTNTNRMSNDLKDAIGARLIDYLKNIKNKCGIERKALEKYSSEGGNRSV